MPVKPLRKNGTSDYVPSVSRSMIVQEILTLCPDAYTIMAEYGLHCSSCSIGGMESLGDGCAMHGFDDETIDALIEDLNDSMAEQSKREAVIHVMPDAAKSLAAIAEKEKIQECCLAIVMDNHGGFCLEFREEIDADDHDFFHEDFPHVKVTASPMVLWRIGGATIDYRGDRFKLDLPEDSSQACACSGSGGGCCKGECSCS